MKITRHVSLMVLALACAPAFAAATSPTAAKPQTAQQQRMATCSAQNKGKKGSDYKAAQTACLKGQSTAAIKTTPQQRMAACASQNKGKKGADYKAAQSACLKQS